jgi:SNF2-related domain/Helicase conserved C-terminal domain
VSAPDVELDEYYLRWTQSQSWFLQAPLQHAADWADALGYLSPRLSDERAARSFTLPTEHWRALQRSEASDPESHDRLITEHELVADLLGVGPERLRVASVGHVHGAHLQLRVTLEGADLDMTACAPPLAALPSGSRTLSPLGSAVVERVRAFNELGKSDSAQQALVIRDLKRLRAQLDQIAERGRPVGLSLDEHLERFTVVEPRRVEARWTDDGRARASLRLYVNDESEPLALDAFVGESGVVSRGQGQSRELVVLDPGTTAVARAAKDLQGRRVDKLPPELLRDPLALIPEGVETPLVDYSRFALDQFSHRVEGFEPARRDAVAFGEGTGTVWYKSDGQAHGGGAVPEPAAPNAETGGEPAEVDGSGARRGPNLRPKLADVAGEAGDELAQADVDTTPWDELTRLLKPGVELKPYQREGVAWLWQRYQAGLSGALLADDMGLGKTLQIACLIALAKARPRTTAGARPSLVVAPIILLDNWQDELRKFFSGTPLPGRIKRLDADTAKGLGDGQGQLDLTLLRKHDVVLTSYQTLARQGPSLLRMDWDVVVLDEAHHIKNHGTQISLAARAMSGHAQGERPRKFDFGICSTGTPVENSLGDIWALYDFCSPGAPFGSYDSFRDELGGSAADAKSLAQRLRVGEPGSSLLRREKEAVLRDLPEKHERRYRAPMTPLQVAMEADIVRAGQKRGGALGIIQNLQALYQHPWLIDKAKLEGSVEACLAESPKLATCLEILSDVRARGEKALVFALWTDMQLLLTRAIKARLGLPQVPILNGDPKNRKAAAAAIERFTASPGFDVMILSPLAAGAGLNIQAANHVIHYGRWWNPAKEDQATARAYRLGQKRPVTVHYPLVTHPDPAHGGFDVKLDQLVSQKRAMARDFLTPIDEAEENAGALRAVGAMEDRT